MSLFARNSGLSTLRPLRAIRRKISVLPSLYVPLRRQRKPDTVVTAQTALLIEGFPRSGNTWTEAVIRHCAPENIPLAHHSHAAAHVVYAASLNVPVMVLFREPDAAVCSYLALYGNRLDVRDAYLDYLAFYRATLPLQNKGVLFFSFEDTTKRSADMIRALRDHFALELSDADLDTEDGQKAIFARMDAKATRLKRKGGKSDSRPGTEDADKARQQARARAAIQADHVQPLRAEAQALYTQMQSALHKKGL